MNERRMSLGNRVISLVLALVMVIGMMPAGVLSAFAAPATDNDTTATNVAKIENYAQMLLEDNFSVYSKADWDSENSSESWKYYNGVMLRAFMMMGVNSDADVTNSNGNALEYLSNYMAADINSSGSISGYATDALDSVPPARMLFYMLGSTVDRDELETAIHYVYDLLDKQTEYKYAGYNLLHKDKWKDGYAIGLDGVYMAQPFLLEYANAIDNKLIANKYGISTTELRTLVYTRLAWIADNMADEVTAPDGNKYFLYNHGVDPATSESGTNTFNHQYWSRGIGWYAAGLVDCIELMPAGPEKTALIGKLSKLFDGMIAFQDVDSGMWYNVVNSTAKISDTNSNRLETSGTALMAYAMLKAFNNGWVGEAYKAAGLKAFNGTVSAKVEGSAGSYSVKDIYKQSGVETEQSGYCEYAYVNNEAKGVGPLIMAAVEANRAIGTAETFKIGVVSAPSGLTVPVNGSASDIDLSDVKVTLVSNRGTVKTQTVSASACTISSTATAGTATVTVKNDGADIDTFTVTVVNPNAAVTALGYINGQELYESVTKMTTGVPYVLTEDDNTDGDVRTACATSSTIIAQESTVNKNGDYYTIVPESGDLTYWYVDSNDNLFIDVNGKPYYVALTGTNSGDIQMTATASQATQYTRATSSGKITFQNKAYTEQYLSLQSAGLQNKGSDPFYVYAVRNSGNKVVLSVQPNTVNLNAGATQALTTKVTVDGAEVDLSKCTITWASNKESVATVSGGTITAKAEGTATITATLSKAPVNGTSTSLDKSISVQITVNVTGAACEHTPNGEGVVTDPTCTAQGYTTYTCSKCGAEYTADETAATGHTEVTVAGKAATCTATGLTEGKHCSVCNEVLEAQETIPVIAHNYVEGVCSVCGAEDPNAGSGETTTSEHNFDATTDVTTGDDKSAIAAGTTYDDGYFEVVGTVIRRVNSNNVTSVEIGKNGTGAMEFTVSGTATVTIKVSSTGDSNKSAVAIVDASGNTVANNENKTEVSGTGKTTLTYTLPAGTYQLVSPESDYGRGFRLYTIDVEETISSSSSATVTSISLSDDTLDIPQNSTEAEVAELLSHIGLNVTYSDGTTKDTLYHLDDSEVTVDAIDTSAAVGNQQIITVSYGGKTTTLEVTITEASSGGTTPDPDPDEPDTPDVPTGSGFVLDTSGNVDWENGEYIVVWYTGSKYYAMQAGSSSGKEVTVTNGVVNISYADASNIIWKFDNGQITNGDYNLKNDSTPSNKTSSADNSTVVALSAADGKYAINLEGDNRWLTYSSSWTRSGTTSDNKNYGVYLYKWSGETGGNVVTPTSATVTPNKVNVANSGTIDLSGVTMEVTMSDGSKKTVQISSLTYDVSGINTALAGTYTVPVSYTENGKTVSANVSVVVAAASSGGGTTTSDLWKHNFSEDGKTDADGFFSISGNLTTSYDGSYGDLDFDTALKIESSTNISFDAPNDGTLTLVFDSGSKDKDIKINGKSYTIDSKGILTVDVSEGEVKITKDDSVYLFYMEYASAVTDGIQITAPGTLYIAGSTGSLNPTHQLQYTVKHNNEQITSGYSIEWTSLDPNVATVDGSGVITGVNPGTTSVSAKVTIGSTVYNGTVLVTVAGPTVSTTEEMSLIFGETGKDTGVIESVVRAGGGIVDSNFELRYKSANENIATVDSNGNVTAKGSGTVIIYTYIKTVNGHTVYNGDGNDANNQPPYFDSTVVTVTKKEVTDAHLNSYDYVIKKADSATNATNLINALTYKEGVNVTGGVTADTGMVLTIEFNTGEKKTLHYGDPGLTVDYSGIDFSKPGIQTALVTYVDPVMGELFRDTIWVHVEDMDLSKFDGVITKEDGIHYVLDNDGINKNEEYIIVAGNGEVALKNPSATSTGTSGATTAAVTLANGVLKSKLDSTKNLFDGAAVDYLTISEADEQQSAWLLDTFVENVSCPDEVVRTQLNASNLSRYLGAGETENQLIHGNVAHVYLETVSERDGEYRIVLGFGENKAPYYLACVDGAWIATTEPESVYMYNKHVEMTDDYGIKFSVTPTKIDMNQGTVSNPIVPTVIYNENTTVSAEDYTIVWSSSDPSVATVDQNGKVTGVKRGSATISATLYDVYGMAVTCTAHNVPYVVRTVTVNVSSTTATPTLIENELTIGVGSMPNLDKVNIVMYYGENNQSNYTVPHDQLNFLMADATNSVDEKVGFNNTKIGTYIVPVVYDGKTYDLTIHVVEDPFAGLEEADSIPGYPDAGSVRMNKIAQGVEDFTKTGIAKIELTAAGVSTKNSVDVVLIVDVSNSMGWTTTWFENMSADEVDGATDSLKIPAGGAGTGTDKLALAMATAVEFADILLNVEGGDNTITFVTFAGADRDHGGSSDHVDSVRTPMVGISEYSIASQVFADTKFTAITKDGDGAKYTLQIGGYSDDGYGEAKVSGSNRGNTNYDYAFGEAIDAVNQLKAKYSATHDGASYDESGRQIHVIFMTDGAPSHYNIKRGNDSKSSSDTSWDGSGTKYSKIDNLTEDNWLAHIKNYNNLATQLYPMIDGAYTIGFDMAHGGFGDYSYALEDMERVLQGLAKNTVVPVEMADNEDELDTYLTSLARALAYPGTKARITDKIGGNFSLFTGVSMYSSDITTPYTDKDGTEKRIMSEDLYKKLAEYNDKLGFPITVYSYRLVTAADVGDELSVINGDGTTATVTVAEKHLGLRVNEDPEILERITFSADGTQAFSDQKEGNIMTIDTNGNRVINAATFTYTATLDTMKIDDVDVVHAAEEEIVWKVGTIEDREVAMEYYAYLDGSLDNPREAKAGVYATNEFAYLEYIDVYGKYVKRYYGVPQIAWGSGNVTVRFYLVDKTTGKFVNRAGVTFTNPANRIFLDGRAQYEAELNSAVTITAKDALVKAGLASHELYDASMAATVTNSTAGSGAISWVNANLPNIDNLKIYTDSSDGYFSNVVIDIPVVMTDLTESLRPMAGANVVIDFSNPVDINVVSTEEKPLITNGYEDVRNPDLNGTKYLYKMEIAGFGTYSADHDLKDYIAQSNITLIQEFNAEQAAANPAQYMYPGKYGYFTITDKDGGNTQIRYTPTSVMGGVENVFVAVKFMEYDISTGAQSDQFYYMYKHLSVVPATVVHYETTDNMEDAFVFEGAWGNIVTDATYQQGVTQSNANAQYGFEANYSGYVNFAGGSSQFVNNTNTDPKAELPSVKFTFTGTGIDIISKTGENQGLITMTLTGKNTGTTKRVRVLNKGTDDLYQLPVLSVENLPYDTYNVEISVYFECKVYGGQFYFDAIKVYGTAEEDEAVSDNLTVGALYKAAGEYKPQIVEIRDILLDNKNFGDIAVAGVSGAVYIDGNSTLGGDSTNFTDYDKIGPNNEVYLSSNQAIAFKLKATDTTNLPATLAIGLKALNTSVDATIIIVDAAGTPYTYSYNGENAINSSTAMFYNLLGADKVTDFLGNADGFTVVIANKDSDNAILSVTDLKIAYGDTEGQMDVIVDNGVAENANAALAASARVESVEVTGDAYAMQTTPITVVTGQAARSVEIVDSNGNMVAVKASFVDGDGGKRTWTILATFTNIRKETITVYGIGTDGNRHIDSATNATVNVMAQNTTN